LCLAVLSEEKWSTRGGPPIKFSVKSGVGRQIYILDKLSEAVAQRVAAWLYTAPAAAPGASPSTLPQPTLNLPSTLFKSHPRRTHYCSVRQPSSLCIESWLPSVRNISQLSVHLQLNPLSHKIPPHRNSPAMRIVSTEKTQAQK